jgi:hypothetical protein
VAKQDYNEYLLSDEWQELREKAYKRSNNLCELCGAPKKAVHHLEYPKHFTDDKLSNVIVVCGVCHDKLHGIEQARQRQEEVTLYKAALDNLFSALVDFATTIQYSFDVYGEDFVQEASRKLAAQLFADESSHNFKETICLELISHFNKHLEEKEGE